MISTGPLTRERALRDGLSIAGLISVIWFWSQGWPTLGYDAYAYWHVDPVSPYHYRGAPDELGAFRYSPAAAQVFGLINWLPWPAFYWLLVGCLFVALVFVGRWWVVALLGYPPVLYSIWLGNIDILIAAAIVAGFRWPAAWAFVLLTKVTPGVGVLWFAVRREWPNLLKAVGVTLTIAAVSFLILPRPWIDWPVALATIRSDGQASDIPLILRVGSAAAVVVWGARTDRRWSVIVAAFLADPQFSLRALAILVGVFPLIRATQPGAAASAGVTASRSPSSLT
ncbi:MAG TPA: glycosyltransferase family 87 protein [Candidatus Polarisedimenticolia bacterium]|nr:glycosyltransferase family 87 protein [Candidatus Polarisedimenticolia bacterium]